jgi:hypothetical protein
METNAIRAFVDLGSIMRRGELPDELMNKLVDAGSAFNDWLQTNLQTTAGNIPVGLAAAYAAEAKEWD